MNLFKKGISEKNNQENDGSQNIKNNSVKKYALQGLILMAISGLVIYVYYIANINDEHHIILPHSALNFHLKKSSLAPKPIYKAKPLKPLLLPATLRKSPAFNKLTVFKTAKLKEVKQNSKIKKTKYANNTKIKTGSYSSVIYRLNKKIEIEKLQHELALIKEGKNTASASNIHTMPNNFDAGIFGLPLRQHVNPLERKTNELSKYFNKNNKHNSDNNAIRLIGVSNKSADISIGKSDFIIQSGCRLYGYQVLKIGRNSITVAKDAKIKKIYIY
jgi:hypothetical protein